MTVSYVMSVRPSVRLHIGSIFMKFFVRMFFQNLSRKFKFHYNLKRIIDTLDEEKYVRIVVRCLVCIVVIVLCVLL